MRSQGHDTTYHMVPALPGRLRAQHCRFQTLSHEDCQVPSVQHFFFFLHRYLTSIHWPLTQFQGNSEIAPAVNL